MDYEKNLAHWVREKYYEFKSFKVYWAYMHFTAEQTDKIGFAINRFGPNGELPLLAYTTLSNKYL